MACNCASPRLTTREPDLAAVGVATGLISVEDFVRFATDQGGDMAYEAARGATLVHQAEGAPASSAAKKTRNASRARPR